MDNADGMRVSQGLTSLQCEVNRLIDGKRTRTSQSGAQIGPLQVFHYHVRRAILELAHVERARYVLTFDLNRGARFAREAHHGFRIAEGFRQQEFDSNRLIEFQMVRNNHHAHATLTNPPLNAVLARQHVAFTHITDYLRAILRHIPPILPCQAETPRASGHKLRQRPIGVVKLLLFSGSDSLKVPVGACRKSSQNSRGNIILKHWRWGTAFRAPSTSINAVTAFQNPITVPGSGLFTE